MTTFFFNIYYKKIITHFTKSILKNISFYEIALLVDPSKIMKIRRISQKQGISQKRNLRFLYSEMVGYFWINVQKWSFGDLSDYPYNIYVKLPSYLQD